MTNGKKSVRELQLRLPETVAQTLDRATQEIGFSKNSLICTAVTKELRSLGYEQHARSEVAV
jgi:hypothetical protein